jgi:glycine cleavage system H protein
VATIAAASEFPAPPKEACEMDVPQDLRYTSDHEWARLEDGKVRVGLTDFAQEALGDIVFVQLPSVGDTVVQGGELGEVESTKSVSQVYAPVGGTVVEVNTSLGEQPECINTDAYGEGWLCVIEASAPAEFEELLDAAGYLSLTES